MHPTLQRGALAQPSGFPRHNLRGEIRRQKGAQPNLEGALLGGLWRCLTTAQQTARGSPQRSFFFTDPRHPEWRQQHATSLGRDLVVPAGTLNLMPRLQPGLFVS